MARGLFIAAHSLLSFCGMRAPECTGSVVAACGLSSCGMCAIEHMGLVAPWHVGS